VYNLGTGKGYSVLEMAKAMRDASGKEIELEFVDRRAGTFITHNHATHDYILIAPPPPQHTGDIATCYADPVKAKKELGWSAQIELSQMMQDTWKWQSSNPQGYPTTNDHLFKA
jgi:UDP-glucose 4-epimerase